MEVEPTTNNSSPTDDNDSWSRLDIKLEATMAESDNLGSQICTKDINPMEEIGATGDWSRGVNEDLWPKQERDHSRRGSYQGHEGRRLGYEKPQVAGTARRGSKLWHDDKNNSSRRLDMKLEALMANPRFQKPQNGATITSSPSTRLLGMPSLSDQLALASSNAVSSTTKTSPTTAAKDLDLRHLVNSKRDASQQTRNSNSGSTATPKGLKPALKKTSSYGKMENIGEGIPINTRKNSWKALPVPKKALGTATTSSTMSGISTRERTKALLRMRRAETSPTLQDATQTSTCNDSESACSTSGGSSTIQRNVSFSKIIVRDYDLTVGDGACRLGPPVALDWSYQEQEPIDLLEYEEFREEPRSQVELYMNSFKRAQLLRQRAVGINDIRNATKQAKKLNRQRARTAKLLPLMKLEDLVESAARKAKRLGKTLSNGSLASAACPFASLGDSKRRHSSYQIKTNSKWIADMDCSYTTTTEMSMRGSSYRDHVEPIACVGGDSIKC